MDLFYNVFIMNFLKHQNSEAFNRASLNYLHLCSEYECKSLGLE